MSSSVSNGSMRGPGPGLPGRGTRARAIPIASTTAVHNAGLIPHFRSLGCTPITSGFHVLHDALKDGPMALHGGREEVHLSVPLSRGRDETILPEDAKMVPDRLVVQDQGPRELLRVPRLLPDREQDPGPGGRPDAAPKQPPQDSFEAVHRDRRGQDRCDSCTLPTTPEKGGQGMGRPVPVGGGHGPWAQPPVVDPLAAAVVFVRSQVCPAVAFPAPVTDPVADAFVDATDPDAVTAFTAHAPATRTARTAIKATAMVVFTRVLLLRLSSG